MFWDLPTSTGGQILFISAFVAGMAYLIYSSNKDDDTDSE